MPSNIGTIDMSDVNSQKIIDDILDGIEKELEQIEDEKDILDAKEMFFNVK